MTKLKVAFARVTDSTVWEAGKERAVVVHLHPDSGVGFRLQGTRRTYWLSPASLYHAAVRAEVEAAKAEKKGR